MQHDTTTKMACCGNSFCCQCCCREGETRTPEELVWEGVVIWQRGNNFIISRLYYFFSWSCAVFSTVVCWYCGCSRFCLIAAFANSPRWSYINSQYKSNNLAETKSHSPNSVSAPRWDIACCFPMTLMWRMSMDQTPFINITIYGFMLIHADQQFSYIWLSF